MNPEQPQKNPLSTDKSPDNQIVNVKELKKKKATKIIIPKDQREPLGPWILKGSVISILISLFAFVDINFLYLTPLGIIIALTAWFYLDVDKKKKFQKNLE